MESVAIDNHANLVNYDNEIDNDVEEPITTIDEGPSTSVVVPSANLLDQQPVDLSSFKPTFIPREGKAKKENESEKSKEKREKKEKRKKET